jgi:acetyl esterase/lipase
MSLRASLTRAIMSLPDPVLRAMAGRGMEAHRDGELYLDPRFQIMDLAIRKRPPLHSHGVHAARGISAAFWAELAVAPQGGQRVEDATLEFEGRAIKVRKYNRVRDDADGEDAILYLHQGGGVIGDLETCDAFCRMLAYRTQVQVFSVDYRLAPEHPFPAGLEDALAAYRWLAGVTKGRVAVGGDSMGGHFAAILCQEARANGWPQPFRQVLIYPALDLAARSQSHEKFGDLSFLSRETMDWFMAQYLSSDASDRTQPRLSPLRQPDLRGLAPALIYTANFDALRDEGEAYARELKSAGTLVSYTNFPTLAHGFTAFTGVVPAARRACETIADDLAKAFDPAD